MCTIPFPNSNTTHIENVFLIHIRAEMRAKLTLSHTQFYYKPNINDFPVISILYYLKHGMCGIQFKENEYNQKAFGESCTFLPNALEIKYPCTHTHTIKNCYITRYFRALDSKCWLGPLCLEKPVHSIYALKACEKMRENWKICSCMRLE